MLKEATKKSISIFVIFMLILNLFSPTITFAEGETNNSETEEITREYEIKQEEQWDVSENGDGSVTAKWTFSNKTLRIFGQGNMKNFSLESETEYKKYNDLIEFVVIEEGITNIGSNAFYKCKHIKEITIPSSVTKLERNILRDCRDLTTINVDKNNGQYLSAEGVLYTKDMKTLLNYPAKKDKIDYLIPDGVTSVDAFAFENCSNLQKITVPSSVTSIGTGAFKGSISLKEIIIPNTIKKIESSVFEECSNLQDITIPNSVTEIGSSAFKGCSNLQDITIPNNVTRINDYTFNNCSSLTSIIIPNNVTSINQYAFCGCSGLTNVKIPSSVTQIGSHTFESCISLQEITIPNSINSLSYALFKECNNLQKIELPNNLTMIDSYAFNECSGLTNITIPDSVTKIGGYVFEGCSSLKEVIIPNGIEKIDDGVFRRCKNLQKVYIPNSVTSIESQAFNGCSNLTDITIPNSVTSIGDFAFEECSNLRGMTIQSSVTKIGRLALYNVVYIKCETNSTAHEYAEANKIGYILTDNAETSIKDNYKIKEEEEWDISKNKDKSVIARWTLKDKLLKISGNGEIKDWSNSNDREYLKYVGIIEKAIIENGITSIGRSTFLGLSNLQEITIPSSIISIERSAFSGCSSLQEIIIPSSVTNMGSLVFYGCSSLNNIIVDENNIKFASIEGVLYTKDLKTLKNYPANKENIKYIIPEGVTNIEYYTFKGCNKLKEIVIPNGVTRINESVFEGCSSLQIITLPSSLTIIDKNAFKGCSSLQEIIIPNSVTSILPYAFSECSSLKEITIPSSVTSIAWYAFEKCKSLQKIIIPDSITSIEYNTFERCSSLKEITIPNSVTKIADYAFSECVNLNKITISSNVTTMEEYAFNGCSSLKEITIPSSVTSIRKESIPENSYIKCKQNSEAHRYAEENGILYYFDNLAPKLTITYSTTEATKGDVIITITSDEQIQKVDGWNVSNDKKILTKSYSKNTIETIKVSDLVGNESYIDVKIENIYQTSIESDTYQISENKIKNIKPNSSFKQLKNNLEIEAESIVLYNTKGEILKDDDVIATGTKIVLDEQDIYTFVVTGDINSDGKSDTKDMLKINKYRLGKEELEGVYLEAGDVTGDGKVDTKDMLKINKMRLGKENI